jgi:hypothetical protein
MMNNAIGAEYFAQPGVQTTTVLLDAFLTRVGTGYYPSQAVCERLDLKKKGIL